MQSRLFVPLLLLFLCPSAYLHAQCADIYDVWNGSGVFTITTSVDSACTWEKSYSAYQTGDALRFTAVSGDTYTFSVCGGVSGADTEINLYRAVTGFPNNAYDDDGCGSANGESSLSWTCTTASDYYLVVSLTGCVNTTVPMTITVSRSSITGDICENAIAVSSGSTAFSTVGSCGKNIVSCATASNDIWFAYTPSTGGMTTFETCGSGFDTHLSMWNVCGGTELACNDDAAAGPCSGTYLSHFTYAVATGTTYYIRVSGYNNNTGSGTLTITPPVGGSSPGDDCSNPYVGSLCGQSYTSQSTVGNGNDQSSWSCGSGSYPGEDAYYAFTTSDGEATALRVSLSNVSDANDSSVELILMSSGSCGAPTCQATASFDIASGTFGNGQDYIDLPVSAIGSAATYFLVVDSRNDGIDAYDISLECYENNVNPNGACSVDDTNADAIVSTWDGTSPAPANVFSGDPVTVCHTIYLNGSNSDGMARLELAVSDCLGSLSSLSPAGGNTGYYDSEGGWRVDSVLGNEVYWSFDGRENACPSGQVSVTVDVNTDSWGSELYWELVPSGSACGSPASIFQGGNTTNVDCESGGTGSTPSGGYGNNLTVTEGPFCLTHGSSYDIKYVDHYGDGGGSFTVFGNSTEIDAFTNAPGTDSATYTFVTDSGSAILAADVSAASYTCNAYTFCYDAVVLDGGMPCNYGDSIQDFIRVFDQREAAAGSSAQSSFYARTGGGDGTILPIELLEFTGQVMDGAVRLDWATATEINSASFLVERSANEGLTWNSVGRLPAAGLSFQTKHYTLWDQNAPQGSLYYRLWAIDQDSSRSMHGPIHVRRELPSGPFSAWPNPSSGIVQIGISADQAETRCWMLVNAQGQTVQSGYWNLDPGFQINVLDASRHPKGMYLLRVSEAASLRLFFR